MIKSNKVWSIQREYLVDFYLPVCTKKVTNEYCILVKNQNIKVQKNNALSVVFYFTV